jgi:hypothetical protein
VVEVAAAAVAATVVVVAAVTTAVAVGTTKGIAIAVPAGMTANPGGKRSEPPAIAGGARKAIASGMRARLDTSPNFSDGSLLSAQP